jgi:hypothetical protein
MDCVLVSHYYRLKKISTSSFSAAHTYLKQLLLFSTPITPPPQQEKPTRRQPRWNVMNSFLASLYCLKKRSRSSCVAQTSMKLLLLFRRRRSHHHLNRRGQRDGGQQVGGRAAFLVFVWMKTLYIVLSLQPIHHLPHIGLFYSCSCGHWNGSTLLMLSSSSP